MDIYASEGAEGILDLSKARIALVGTRPIREDAIRRERIAEVTAGALLDIAASLRPLGREAADALRGRIFEDVDETSESVVPEGVGVLSVGDLVVAKGDTEPGEIIGFGVDQDAPYAEVKWAESGMETRTWLENLEKIDEREPGDDVRERVLDNVTTMRPDDGLGLVGTVGHEDAVAALRELNAEADGEPDFDDADFEAAVPDALAKLAEKKPSTKKGGKK